MQVALSRKRLLLITFIALVAIAIPSALIITKGNPLQTLLSKQVKVELKTTYKNPFEKTTQYVNPFQKYKNPFVVNR